jgi:hypothetical protein
MPCGGDRVKTEDKWFVPFVPGLGLMISHANTDRKAADRACVGLSKVYRAVVLRRRTGPTWTTVSEWLDGVKQVQKEVANG